MFFSLKAFHYLTYFKKKKKTFKVHSLFRTFKVRSLFSVAVSSEKKDIIECQQFRFFISKFTVFTGKAYISFKASFPFEYKYLVDGL